jgi:hypothetical protein
MIYIIDDLYILYEARIKTFQSQKIQISESLAPKPNLLVKLPHFHQMLDTDCTI